MHFHFFDGCHAFRDGVVNEWQEFLDLLLRVNDLDDDGKIAGQAQDLGGV